MKLFTQRKVAIDWGSTSFRAYLFDGDSVVDNLESSCGITNVGKDSTTRDFYSTLYQQIGSWLTPGDSILLCGMITSANGWIETPYIPCPVDSRNILTSLVRHDVNNHTLYFVPGISQREPHADVMRGEEVQLLGLEYAANQPGNNRQLVIMPGTHSKWAVVKNGSIEQFRTIVTGELFSALRNHTLIGRLAIENSWCEQTFLDAVELGYNDNNPIGNLFAARSAVLLNVMQASQVNAYLSGLLIGNEIREATGMLPDTPDSVTIIGSASLTNKYLNAFNRIGIAAARAVPGNACPDITAAGFASIISQARV